MNDGYLLMNAEFIPLFYFVVLSAPFFLSSYPVFILYCTDSKSIHALSAMFSISLVLPGQSYSIHILPVEKLNTIQIVLPIFISAILYSDIGIKEEANQ